MIGNDFTPFTQSQFYAQWQEAGGRKIIRGENFFAIKYPLLDKISYLYIPHGPLIKNPDAEKLERFKDECQKMLIEEKAAFLRFDIFPPATLPKKIFIPAPKYAYHGAHFQPSHEYLVDVSVSQDELASSLHPKSRYNVNLARRHGVEIEIVEPEGMYVFFDTFMKLLGETARRGRFSIHPRKYYHTIFARAPQDRASFLVMARHRGQPLVAHLMVIHQKTATFVFTGSASENRQLKATYLSRWSGMLEAKRRGATVISFGGVGLKWQGVTAFKTQYMEGEIFKYSDFYDVVGRPFWYWLYCLRKRF